MILLVQLLLVSLAVLIPVGSGLPGLDSRIVGGYHCDIEEYPYIVDIYFDDSLCGGSIINSKWVLTAGHCVNTSVIEKGKAWLYGGSSDSLFFLKYQKSTLSHQPHQIVKGILHPNYRLFDENELEKRFDIGLLQVYPEIELGGTMQMARFGRPEICPGMATAVGWGKVYSQGVPADFRRKFTNFFQNIKDPQFNEYSNTVSARLKCVDLPVISLGECRSRYPPEYQIDNSVLCTYKTGGGEDACFGDSGGPLVCQNRVVGLTSTGIGCALDHMAAAFTKVWHYGDFIAAHTGRNIWTEY